jgi:hypothetical protein
MLLKTYPTLSDNKLREMYGTYLGSAVIDYNTVVINYLYMLSYVGAYKGVLTYPELLYSLKIMSIFLIVAKSKETIICQGFAGTGVYGQVPFHTSSYTYLQKQM